MGIEKLMQNLLEENISNSEMEKYLRDIQDSISVFSKLINNAWMTSCIKQIDSPLGKSGKMDEISHYGRVYGYELYTERYYQQSRLWCIKLNKICVKYGFPLFCDIYILNNKKKLIQFLQNIYNNNECTEVYPVCEEAEKELMMM